MRNTGCSRVSNQSGIEFHVVDGENPARNVLVAPGAMCDFGGTVLPWCSDSSEIARRAFRFHRGRGGPIAFYVFQSFHDDTVRWTPGNGGAPSWDAAVPLAEPCQSVTLTIGDDGTPVADPQRARTHSWPLPSTGTALSTAVA